MSFKVFVVFFLLNISLSLPVAVMLMIIFLVPLPSSDAKPHGVDPSGSSTENGEHQIENKVATIEKPLERSQNLSDPVRTLQMSTFMDVNQRIADLLQGTLSNALSIASFLSKVFKEVLLVHEKTRPYFTTLSCCFCCDLPHASLLFPVYLIYLYSF
ncbi:hypothetical protein PVK06_043894 [Gossypium arboreum]|uniref:Uncharacterized protein n=1 Tax=Gossypium arboreum TaxID=29729 RepID=A0ABR0MQ55_GOSAR|nr:hypothetical protein PVK06_043894 [Gossypium arboreum]